MDINNSTLLSILVQGKNLSTPSTNIDGFLVWLKLFLVKQTGLIKQSWSPVMKVMKQTETKSSWLLIKGFYWWYIFVDRLYVINWEFYKKNIWSYSTIIFLNIKIISLVELKGTFDACNSMPIMPTFVSIRILVLLMRFFY